MGPRSEDEVAAALAAAVEIYAGHRAESKQLPEEIEEGLHSLLYERKNR
jgi:dihydroorotate dehydrogenase